MNMSNLPRIPTRKVIALALTAAYIYLLINQLPIPEHFAGVFGLVVGCYYGKSTALETLSQKGGEKRE